MHDDNELYHLARLADSIEDKEVKKAFYLLITEIYRKYGNIARPASQGNFSVLQIRPNGRNCFAFKGAKQRIRWYFRKPAFKERLSSYEDVLKIFPSAEEVQGGEIAVNLHNSADASAILAYLDKYFRPD